MLEFINFFTGIISKYVNLLFSLELHENVSVGSFLLGCAVFSLVIGYLIGRFTISYDDSYKKGFEARNSYIDKKVNDAYEKYDNL